jgi:hypothetical protein
VVFGCTTGKIKVKPKVAITHRGSGDRFDLAFARVTDASGKHLYLNFIFLSDEFMLNYRKRG